MEYRPFRNTGVRTSVLGLGCMRLPRVPGQGEKIDYPKAEEIIDYAYTHGVNYFDTAYVYHGGESESVIGRALRKYPRESYFLATKMPGFLCKNEADVRRIFQEQLQRCGVDYFDFYLCHNVNDESIENYMAGYIIPVLEEFKAQGKIRYLGFSSHGNPETLARFADLRPWDFVQIQFNYLDWEYQNAEAQYKVLRERNLPIMVMEPVRGGRLASLCPEADALFQGYTPDASVASWALRWAMGHEGIQVVLSGMSTMEQVADNVATASALRPVSDAEQGIIDQAVAILKEKALLPCTGCRYCIECPKGLDIPALLAIYNNRALATGPMVLRDVLDLPPEKRPDQCIACGACMRRCPQSIEVPKALASLAQAVKEAFPDE